MGWKFLIGSTGACVGAWAGVKIAGATTVGGMIGAGAVGAVAGTVGLPLAAAVAFGALWGTWWLTGKLVEGTIGKFFNLVQGPENRKSLDQLEAEFNRDRKEREQVKKYLEKMAAREFNAANGAQDQEPAANNNATPQKTPRRRKRSTP